MNNFSTTNHAAMPSNSTLAATWSSIFADYLQLAKPRILVMILLTVGVAMIAVPQSTVTIALILHAMLGTSMVAASASVMNQWLERERDAKMQRTMNRPLPGGRLTPLEAMCMGWILVIGGTLYLAIFCNISSATIGLLTWILYVWIYTPMKTFTWWNTAVGTIPGALPVMIGWTAAGGRWNDWQGWLLTSILILWQFPHFMAIAWLYRDQYAQAGYRMLTNVEPTGVAAAWHAIVPAVLLVPLSLVVVQPTSWVSWLLGGVAACVAAGQVVASYQFLMNRDRITGKRLLRSSLLYLPAVLLVVVLRVCLPDGF